MSRPIGEIVFNCTHKECGNFSRCVAGDKKLWIHHLERVKPHLSLSYLGKENKEARYEVRCRDWGKTDGKINR